MGAGRRLLDVVLVLVVVAVVAKPVCENSSFSGLPTPHRLPGPDTAALRAPLTAGGCYFSDDVWALGGASLRVGYTAHRMGDGPSLLPEYRTPSQSESPSKPFP